MTRSRRPNRPLVVALYANAALLLAILVALLSRGGSGFGSSAFAAPPVAPIAGGGGLYLMPAQFSVGRWGCYIMDTDAQTLCAYEYAPSSEGGLRLVAARYFKDDRQLKRYNTKPDPDEMKHFIEMERNPVRGRPETNPQDNSPAPAPSDVGNTSPPGAGPDR